MAVNKVAGAERQGGKSILNPEEQVRLVIRSVESLGGESTLGMDGMEDGVMKGQRPSRVGVKMTSMWKTMVNL